jgi:hypothetical protein
MHGKAHAGRLDAFTTILQCRAINYCQSCSEHEVIQPIYLLHSHMAIRQDSGQALQAAQHRGVFGFVIAWFGLWVKACLDAWEEGLIGLLRESLAITQRAINGASAWTLSGMFLM